MSSLIKLINNRRGDTIVEVLIAVAVVSTILVGAFTISNVSLTQIRMAQERSEAQKVGEQAVENIDRMIATDDTLLSKNSTEYFCREPGTYNALSVDPNASSPTADCFIQGRYLVSINRAPDTAPSYGFRVTVTWDSASGSSVKEKMFIDYRALKPRGT